MPKKFVIWRRLGSQEWKQVSFPMERLAALSEAQDRQDVEISAGRDPQYQVLPENEVPS